MPNAKQTSVQLERYLKARIPFISVRTSERSRAVEVLRDLQQKMQISISVHTLSQGLRDIATDAVVIDDKSVFSALELASQQVAARNNLTYVFTDMPDLSNDSTSTRQIYDLVTLAVRRGGVVVVITSDPVWSHLQRLGMSVTLDPPDYDEMKQLITSTFDQFRGQIRIDWTDEETTRAASILAGLTRLEAENVLVTLLAKGSVVHDDLAELSRAKDQIFSDISGIERVHLSGKAEVGGLDGLQTWLDRERPFLTADLREREMRPPRGVLLVGVPGCGKSLSAKAIASSWELPLYRLDLANIQGMYVGQSESRLRDALATADSVAPCVLWIDEIEKGLAGRNDTSGVTTRLIGHFLYWLQESTSRVFVVATANDVRSLPPELLRRGRFDELFFVDLPADSERRAIIDIYLDRYVRGQLPEPTLRQLVAMSEGFAGSDLESVVRDLGKEEIRTAASVTADYAIAAFANVVPLSRTNPEIIEEIRRWGRERALPASRVGEPAEAQAAGRTRQLLF